MVSNHSEVQSKVLYSMVAGFSRKQKSGSFESGPGIDTGSCSPQFTGQIKSLGQPKKGEIASPS